MGIDLLDFFRGDLPPGRVRRLLGQVPSGCRLQAVIQADPTFTSSGAPVEAWREHWGWDLDRHLLADIRDAVAAQAFKDPKPYPRPGTKKQGASLASFMPPRRPTTT